MVKLMLSLAFALAFLALPVTANPIITVNTVGKSSFHPAKMHLALSGLGNRFEIGKFQGDFGFSGSTWETGAAMVGFSAPESPSCFKLIGDRPNHYEDMTPGNPVTGPVFNVSSIPEPTTLLLFGLLAMVLVLRSRWATWHR